MPMSQMLGLGAPEITRRPMAGSFDPNTYCNGYNFSQTNDQPGSTQALPLAAQPPIPSSLAESLTFLNFPKPILQPIKSPPTTDSDLLPQNRSQLPVLLEGRLESDPLIDEASDSEMEGEMEESNFHDDEELSCDLEPEIVCFGMFVGIAASSQTHSMSKAATYAVELQTSSSFVDKANTDVKGDVGSEFQYLTTALLADADTELQVVCSVTEDALKVANSGKRFFGPKNPTKCSLNIILYGHIHHADDILLFIDQCNEQLDHKYKLYLQDPVGCDRNVRYCNPQRLPPLDPQDYQYTQDLGENRRGFVEMKDLEPPPELLELLDSQEDLPEALQPSAITTKLKRFTNRVSGARQDHEPPSFYGGIIADPMGLGKTLAMLSLVASDSCYMAQNDDSSSSGVLGEESCSLTLIVVPPALLGMWNEELTK
ncbi:hypothetical protein CTRI78_v011941 [Colletotrichum trifolii]|uniref:SNF2 N-terminal domain-containing protein n=1 Tax=Colletotrichum trifolii TaxID=5466 RepID=A0A4V3HQX7_COLTR|nr:hypothetical protein CTRI78_v011941 [Colletotrichum trifolii]